MFQNLIDILAAPTACFKRLQEKPSVLLPLLLVMVCTASISIGYVFLVDKSFIIEQAVDQTMAANPNQDASLLRENLNRISPVILAIPSAVLIVLVTLIWNSLYAAYLGFFTKPGAIEYTFKHWFSLLCWSNVPTIFAAFAAWAVLLSSSTGLVRQDELQVLSITSLLAIESDSFMLQYLSLPQLWAMGLLVVGYRKFTEQSWLKAGLVSLGPWLLIYGIVSLFILF